VQHDPVFVADADADMAWLSYYLMGSPGFNCAEDGLFRNSESTNPSESNGAGLAEVVAIYLLPTPIAWIAIFTGFLRLETPLVQKCVPCTTCLSQPSHDQ
jgi:hypothetical protein